MISGMKRAASTADSSPMSSFGRFFRQLVSPAARKSSSSSATPPPQVEEYNNRIINSRQLSFSAPLSSSKDDDDNIHRVFNYFDEDGDGKISAWELQSRLRTVGGDQLSDEEAEMVVRTSDEDGDGVLGLDDFAKMMEGGEEKDKVEELREAFGMYSTKSNSKKKNLTTRRSSSSGDEVLVITPRSLKRMLSRLGQSTTENDCKAMIGRFDLNGDGVLDFDEFRAMMR